MTQPISQFLTLTFFKEILQVTDTLDDNSLLQFVNNANRKVHTTLSPYVDTPIIEGSPYFSRCSDAALAYARSLQSEDIEQLAKAENYLKKYNYEMYGMDEEHGLIQELKSIRTDRTRTIMISDDPRANKVPMPTQNLLFTFDDYS